MPGADAWERERAVLGPFESRYGLGCVGVAGLAIGAVGGAHVVLLGLSAWRARLVFLLAVIRQNSQTANSDRTDGALESVAWCLYAVGLCAFHASEFVTTALFKPADLSYDSFLLNHSREYTLAACAACAEYVQGESPASSSERDFAAFWIERLLFPSMKRHPTLVAVGLCTVVVGHGLRVAAMWTAGSNFAHRIMTSKDPSHRLVTHGVYAHLRHPAYTGWFWWSIGTQVLLANPVCALGYAYASWAFFAARIPYEEETLAHFYPDEYPAYVKRTWVAIPAIPSGGSPDEGHED